MTDSFAAFAVPGDINTLTGGYIYERKLLNALRALGHPVDHLTLSDGYPNPSPADIADTMAQLQKLGSNKPVIIDGLAFGAMDATQLASVKAPIIALVHHPLAKENGISDGQRDALFTSEKANLAYAAHVLVPSPHTAKSLVSDYGVPRDKITIARPGTDIPAQNSTPLAPPHIVSVGIQLPRKGHDILMQALAKITDLDWQATIVGTALDPDYTQHLRDLHTQLDLGTRVTFAGEVQPDALRDIYQSASIFALATRYEGYGIVFDEALAHGLPTVSCRTGAVPDTVPKDAGLLVDPDNPDQFANALRELLEDPAKRENLASAARTAGQNLPTWTDTARIVQGVLKRFKQPKSAIGRSINVYYRDQARSDRMDALNAQFVGQGSLAFDIGAHVGDRTGSFVRAGARVVALEPQPRVSRALRLLQGRDPAVTLVPKAIGAAAGHVTLHVNQANPTISTASSALMDAAGSAQEWEGQVWDSTVEVPMTTLDTLIDTYGTPDFVKIDVEGFEAEALRGLSHPLPVLSFEFTTIQRDVAYDCIAQLANLGTYTFNFSLGEDHRMQFETWVSATDMRDTIADLPAAANSGDVFARLT